MSSPHPARAGSAAAGRPPGPGADASPLDESIPTRAIRLPPRSATGAPPLVEGAVWCPGTAYGLVWRAGVAVFDGAIRPEVIQRAWLHLDAGSTMEELLALLDRSRPSTAHVRATGAVALVEDAGVHVAVSGPFRVGATGSGGRLDLDGSASGWVDRHLTDAREVTVARQGVWAPPSLIVLGGIVQADAITWGADATLPAPGDDNTRTGPVDRPGPGTAEPGRFEAMFGATTQRRVEDAAVRAPAPTKGSGVLCALCPDRHPNPPRSGACRICGGPVAHDAVRLPQPSIGRLRTSTGSTVELTGTVRIGRKPTPRTGEAIDGPVPLLLPLNFPHISATHLEIRVDGWSLWAIDLGSTNGTHLRRADRRPQPLRGHTPVALRSGDLLDLGNGVSLRFEFLS
ncbi:MAG: FHA domain-containing protein [Dermatophilaceae bacterium]